MDRRWSCREVWWVVVDRDEIAIEVTRLAERLEHLFLVDDIASLRRGMHVAATQDFEGDLVLAKQKSAALLRCGLARVREDLVSQLSREDEPHAVHQLPPAIAGITMTSLPSGTAALLPPRARASSSPM